MSYHSTYYTSTSSVTGSRLSHTKTVTISGRPIISFVKGEKTAIFPGNPRVVKGFDTILHLVGYNFKRETITVYVSTTPTVYTNHLSGNVAEHDLFSTYKNLSSVFPAFSGFEISEFESISGARSRDPKTMSYRIVNDNTLSITLCAAQNAGNMEIIVANKAGYTTLANDTSGRIVDITT